MLRTLLQTPNKLKVAYSNALVVLTQPHVCLLKTVYSMFAFTQLLRTDARILLLTVFVLTKKNKFCRTLAMLTLVRSLADAHITSKLFAWAFKFIRFHNNVYPIYPIHSISSWKFAMPWYRYYIDPHFKQDIKPWIFAAWPPGLTPRVESDASPDELVTCWSSSWTLAVTSNDAQGKYQKTKRVTTMVKPFIVLGKVKEQLYQWKCPKSGRSSRGSPMTFNHTHLW